MVNAPHFAKMRPDAQQKTREKLASDQEEMKKVDETMHRFWNMLNVEQKRKYYADKVAAAEAAKVKLNADLAKFRASLPTDGTTAPPKKTLKMIEDTEAEIRVIDAEIDADHAASAAL